MKTPVHDTMRPSAMELSSAEQDLIQSVVNLLSASRSLLFITGAGISADSGLPTYRGIGGLYNSGATDEGFPIEVASPAICSSGGPRSPGNT